MGRRTIRLLGLAAAMAFFGTAGAQDQTNDELTRQLFEQYVARRSKINTESVLAATHLVAERGRVSGFWRNILAELQRFMRLEDGDIVMTGTPAGVGEVRAGETFEGAVLADGDTLVSATWIAR